MDQRTKAFESYRDHAWLSRSFKKLRPEDLQFCRDVLAQHATTSKDAFVHIVVRLYIDRPTKPKAWKEIEELLICANSTLV
jgi:hypothetical protein